MPQFVQDHSIVSIFFDSVRASIDQTGVVNLYTTKSWTRINVPYRICYFEVVIAEQIDMKFWKFGGKLT